MIIILAGLIVYVQFTSRNFIQTKLSEALHQPVQVGHVLYHFPFGFRVVNLNVGDFLSVKRMYVQFNPKTIFENNIEISEIELINPTMMISQQAVAASVTSTETTVPVGIEAFVPSENPLVQKYIYHIQKIIVNDGLLNYVNKGAEQPVTVEISHLNGQLTDVKFPLRTSQTKFNLDGTMNVKNTPFVNNQISAKGWTDLSSQDSQGIVSVRDQKGVEQLTVNLAVLNKELSVYGKIKINASQVNNSAAIIVNQLAQEGEGNQDLRLEAGFSFKRKLSDFRLDDLQIPFQGAIVSPDEAQEPKK